MIVKTDEKDEFNTYTGIMTSIDKDFVLLQSTERPATWVRRDRIIIMQSDDPSLKLVIQKPEEKAEKIEEDK